MTRDGGPVDEPTSYGLQPPTLPAQQGVPGHAPERAHQEAHPTRPRADAAADPGSGHPGGADGAAPDADAPGAAYEPTRAVPQPPAGSGTPPAPGRLLGGRYRLGTRLGHGGMGTVWRAHDEVVDRDVAVKESRVPDHLSEQERQTMYQRMHREARAAASIDHPSVVTVHDVVMEDGRPWIVMELVRGRSLGDVLEEGTLSAREAARIGLAVLGALVAAHEAGVLHRDVKPDNVLLGRHDRVVLTDFGIAQVEGEQRLTETGAFVGSPEFIAPERVLGQRPGPESDLWSLGVVLYAAVEGVSPFRRSNTPATLQAVLSAEPQTPARAQGALGTAIMRLLRKDPGMRPDIAELRQVLAETARPPAVRQPVSGGGAGGTLTARITRTLRTSRRARFGSAGGVLAAVLALVLILANPFADDGVPDGWRTHDEDKLVKATVAVPGEYTRSADKDNVFYEDPGGVYSVHLSREGGIEESSLENANYWKGYYEEGAEVDYSDTMAEVQSRVNDKVEHQGVEAAEVVTTWQDPDADDTDGAGGVVHRRHELIVVSDDNTRWRLYVDMPDAKEHRTEGEKIYRDVVESLHINEL